MNYDMQGMELIPELFTVLKTAKGRNQEGASSVDGLTRPLVSRRARVKGTSRRTARELPRLVSKLSGRSQRMDPSLRLGAFIARETVTGSGTAPST